MENFKCENCGVCCSEAISEITGSDIRRWEEEGRKDIFKYVNGFKFIEKDGKCPFHNKNRCTIYETRPMVCRNFPINIEHLKDYTKGKCKTLQ